MATLIYAANPESGFTIMMALSMFGAMSTWGLIFVTHLFFRRSHKRSGEKLKYKLPFYPLGSLIGALLMVALLITTLFTKEFTMTLLFGVPFAVVVAILYFVLRKRMVPADIDGSTELDGDAALVNETA